MSLPLDLEVAKERMLQARGALQSYLDSGTQDVGKHKQLSDALSAAIDEFLNTLTKLAPKDW